MPASSLWGWEEINSCQISLTFNRPVDLSRAAWMKFVQWNVLMSVGHRGSVKSHVSIGKRWCLACPGRDRMLTRQASEHLYLGNQHQLLHRRNKPCEQDSNTKVEFSLRWWTLELPDTDLMIGQSQKTGAYKSSWKLCHRMFCDGKWGHDTSETRVRTETDLALCIW